MFDCLREPEDHNLYRQCLLRRGVDDSRLTQVAYIPAALAVEGSTIAIRDRDSWVEWIVEAVFGATLEGDSITRHRKADIRGAGQGKSRPVIPERGNVKFDRIVMPRFAADATTTWPDIRSLFY